MPKLQVLAELVIHPLAAAIEEVAAGIEVEDRQDARLQGLPPPMVPGVHDRAPSSCYMQVRGDGALQLPPAASWQDNARVATCCYFFNAALPQEEFKLLVKNARGFEYRPEHPDAPTILQQKWGWSGSL